MSATGGRSRLLRGVLRGAFGLQLLGMEDAVASEAAVGQRLGIVLEGIRRRLGAAVRNLKRLIVLDQDKLNFCAVPLDRARLHISRDAQPLGVGRISHAAQFFNRDVVALTLLDAGISHVSKRQQDDYRRATEFKVPAGFAGHKNPRYTNSIPRLGHGSSRGNGGKKRVDSKKAGLQKPVVSCRFSAISLLLSRNAKDFRHYNSYIVHSSLRQTL